MAKRFMHFLKIFGITFGAFVGGIGIYLGVVFLVTGFKPEVIKIENLRFSQDEYFFSDKDENGDDVENITIMLMSDPENTTQTQVTLDFSKGIGHDVVALPISEGAEKCIVNVNEPIALKLLRDSITNDVIGGEIVLTAIGVENNMVSAMCYIYLDTPVSSFDVSVTKGEEGANIITGTGENASKIFPGYELNCSVKDSTILPVGSRQPFNEIFLRQEENGVKEEERIRNEKKKVFWESSDTTRATVDADGKVSVLSTAAPGEVVITGRIYKTYELQDSHKTLFDFEYDVNIALEDAASEYAKYLEKITAVKSFTLKINDMDVDNISSSVATSVSGFHYTVGVNETTTFYLDGDYQNSLGISINPSSSVTESFTSADLRYKLSRMFVIPSYAQGGVTNIQNGNDCLKVTSLKGSLENGYSFSVSATYPQSFTEKATCLIIGLGVWDDETQSLLKNPDGTYVLDKNIDNEEINYLTIYLEITTKEAELLEMASSEKKYTDIAKIDKTSQNIQVDIDGSVKLDAYIRYTNIEGQKVTVSGQAGLLTPNKELTYSMVAFFVPENEVIDYDDTYGIDLGGIMYYPIGTSAILSAYNSQVLTQNSVISKFKTVTGENNLKIMAVILKTDINGNILLVDENNARPVDEDGKIIEPTNYQDYIDTMELFYGYTLISSGSNFNINVTKQFDATKLTVSQKYGTNDYEVLSTQNNNLNQIYINDGSSEDYVYLWVHYEDENESSSGKSVLQSAYTLGNFKIVSDDAFAKVKDGVTNDGVTIEENDDGTDILFVMGKMGNTSKPITVKMILNNEIIFSYYVSITNKVIEKLYLQTNATLETSEVADCEKITVTVAPSDQNTNSNWSVKSYDELTATTTNVPLEIKSLFSYSGADENLVEINQDYDVTVYYTIASEFNGEYGSVIKNNGNMVASLTNNNRYYLTSKSQPDNDYYGTINFFTSGKIYLKATIAPYNEDIKSQKIYELNIVVDEQNWTFNKNVSEGKTYLQVGMPLINNLDISGETKYEKVALDGAVGGLTGTYAQLFDTDESIISNDVSTLLIDLSKFVSVTYNGSVLNLSSNVEHTKFLNFEIVSYNVYSPSSGTYDIIKDSSYKKAEIFYDQDAENYFLRVKALNHNTRINLKVTTYFGIKDTFTILVTSPIVSQITSGYSEVNQEYVAKNVEFNLLNKINISTTSYILNNAWVGNADLTNDSFERLMTSFLTSTGVANETNSTDTTSYIQTSQTSTQIKVVKDTTQMISFKLNMAFDMDRSIENGALDSQELEWATYYYVRLIPSMDFSTNYVNNIYQYNNVTYKNFFIGQTYNFDELDYIVWNCLKLDENNNVALNEKGNPIYINKTDELNLKFETSAFNVSNDGHEIYDGKGMKIASIIRNAKNYYNILVIEANIFDGISNPNALLAALKIDNDVINAIYNIRINPLQINVTSSSLIETYVGTTYDMNDSIIIKSSTNNDNLNGLVISYELPEIFASVDNMPTIKIDKDGLITITPVTALDDLGNAMILNPSSNFNFDVIVRVGTIEKTINFVCGRIYSSFDATNEYKYTNIIESNTKEMDYVSMLEGSILSSADIVNLRSTIVDPESSDPTKKISFSNYKIISGNYVLYNNAENYPISNLNLSLQKVNENYFIYYREQILVSLNSIDGRIESTTYLPDNYSLYFYVTCVYNTSYSYNLPIRINSIVFNSTLEQSPDVNLSTDANGNTTIYLVSCVDDENSLNSMDGNYITAKSVNYINANDSNTAPFNKNGDLTLELSFSINNMDNVTISSINNVNYVYAKDSNGNQKEICQITSLGAIKVTNRLSESYEFNLEVKYIFSNSTSHYSICTFKVVILPEYALVQRDNSVSYSQENPYEVSLANTTSINLLSATDGVLILKHVKYSGTKIEFISNEVAFEMIENVSPIIIDTEFSYSLVNENDPNRAIVAAECMLQNNILSLPYSISSDVLLKVTAKVTINSSDEDRQISYYDYYFLVKAGVTFDIILNKQQSKVINEERYYNVTTDDFEANDNNILVLNFSDVFALNGDMTNISGYSISLSNAYLTDYMGNDFVTDGISLKDNTISLTENGSTISTISYVSSNNRKRLQTSYAMQKEVYIKLYVSVSYRSGNVTFALNLRFMPKVLVSSTAQNTTLSVIAGEMFKFNNYLTMIELNSENFTYGPLSQELSEKFTRNIKFKVGDVTTDYSFNDQYPTSATLTSVEEKQVDIILTNNLDRITLFKYTLKIHPLYKFVLESTNAENEVELFEGQTEILPNKYIFVYSVKSNGTSYELLNGEPTYILNELQTDNLTIEIPVAYATYARSVENKKVYIKTYNSEAISANAKLSVAGRYITHVVPIRILDINVTIEKFDNHDVTEENPIILPAGTNEQVLIRSRLTDDTQLYFYNLYYKVNNTTKMLYYNTASTYHRLVISEVTSTSNNYAQKVGTENVVEYALNPSTMISFADNKLTVSGNINEEVKVTVMIYIGDVADTEHILYFTFLPVKMENLITKSYINNDGQNFQILANQGGDSILINQYLKLSSEYKVDDITYKPSYDFTNRIKFTFPSGGTVDPITGAFRFTLSGTQDIIQLTSLEGEKVSIRLMTDSDGTKLVLDQRLWETSIQEFELVIKAQIGLLEEYLRFYVSPVAFMYNYAYRASTGTYYYYHSTYIDYAYSDENPYSISNEIDVTSLILGDNSNVELELEKANISSKTLSTTSQESAPINDSQMGNVNSVIGYVSDSDGLNYAFLKYSGGRYFLSFNVGTRTIVVNKINYSVPVIDETLDLYLTMKKGDIERSIHMEILPYIQMRTSLNDTYERVNENGTPDDHTDDTIELYDYYLSGNSYMLDYFYNFNLESCYDDTKTLVKNIKNTVLTNVSLSQSVGVIYEIKSYERCNLKENEPDGYYIEESYQTFSSLPTQDMITFDNSTLTIDSDLDYVVYLIIKGRAHNGYESYFYLKVIPNILFDTIDENDEFINKTTSGEKFEFVTIEDKNEDFIETALVANAVVSSVDVEQKITTVRYNLLEETSQGTVQNSYEAQIDIYSNNLNVGNAITIYYNPKDKTQAVMGGFSECLATVKSVIDNTVTVEYSISVDEVNQTFTSSFVEKNTTLTANSKVLIKYSTDIPQVIKYAGYLKSESLFSESNAVETILTGKDYDLREYLCAYTPSIENNKIKEYYNETCNDNFTVYADKTLSYKVKYAWYYSSLTDETNKPIAIMADISNSGNVIVDGQEVVTILNDTIHASSSLAFDIYLNIEGTYQYNAIKTYKKNFYLRIVPAMKFFLVNSVTNQEREVGKGETTLSIESVSDEYITTMDDGTRTINLSKYIKARRIVSEDGRIQINGNIVAYNNQLVLSYEMTEAKVYTILSTSSSNATGKLACDMLLAQNGLTFDDGEFTLEKIYNATCDINITISTVIDDIVFSFDILIQLYRESLIDIAYIDSYVQDETIVYETIVSGTDQNDFDVRNSIDFNDGYLTPYVWSSEDSSYVKSSVTGKVKITAHSICKANSPAGQDKTSIQTNIVTFDDANGTITAKDEILGDYYFTIQVQLYYNGKYNNYTYYFRVLGRYAFETSQLEHTTTTSEQILYNQMLEPQRTAENGSNPIYAKSKIMTTTNYNSDGLILIATRTVNASNQIITVYDKTFLNGLRLESAQVETANNGKTNAVWNSPNSVENNFTFTFTEPTSSNTGEIALSFNEAHYDLIGEVKKPLYITLNFTFNYTNAFFQDVYSIQYEIMFVPNEE